MSWIMINKEEIMEMDLNMRCIMLNFLLSADDNGQVLTTVKKLQEETRLTTKEVRVSLMKLEKSGKIRMESNYKHTVITVSDFSTYLSLKNDQGQTKGKPRANQGQTKGKLTDEIIICDIDNCEGKNTPKGKPRANQGQTKGKPRANQKQENGQITAQGQTKGKLTNETTLCDIDNCEGENIPKGKPRANQESETGLLPFFEKKENDIKEKKEDIISKEKETISINRDSKEKERDEFDLLIEEWIAYRRRIKKTIKTERGLEWIKSRLKNLSKGDPEMARKIIDQSMDHEWQGLFELKEEKNDRKRETRQDLLHNIPTTFVGSSTI